MSSHAFAPRRSPRPAAVAALDFGLRVRINVCAEQRSIFSGAENLSAQELTSELAALVGELRVHSFAFHPHPARPARARFLERRLEHRGGRWEALPT